MPPVGKTAKRSEHSESDGDEVEVTINGSCKLLELIVKALDFTLSETGRHFRVLI